MAEGHDRFIFKKYSSIECAIQIFFVITFIAFFKPYNASAIHLYRETAEKRELYLAWKKRSGPYQYP
jgi:hypothetical protein